MLKVQTCSGSCKFKNMKIVAARGTAGSALQLVLAVIVMLSLASRCEAVQCSDFNDGVDGPYWTEVANCTGCARQVGCGYCLSTLSCVAGDDVGPSDFSPCPEWVYDEPECPVKPTCEQYSDCSSCAGVSDCVSHLGLISRDMSN